MSNKGFISSATSFIRQIKQNLSEGRYALDNSGFAILKELVQNADDAGEHGASVIHIGIRDPIPKAEHPLLRSPGMFVINDGAFEKHDAENIHRFGENTKAIDVAKIGKFGLGLKSIFHLCEAFFFFWPIQEEGRTRYRADILNPWSDDSDEGFHLDWDIFSKQDQQLLFGALRPRFGGSACFALWIPLRQKGRLEGNEPISHFYPGDDPQNWLTATSLALDVAALLPLLRNLQSVQLWSGIDGNTTETLKVTLGDQSERRLPFAELVPRDVHRFGGVVSITGSDSVAQHVQYFGAEWHPSDARLVELHEDEHWPSDLGRDPESGRAKIVKEKAQQHAGICLTLGRVPEGGTGRLSISWAVFLPLGEPETITVPDVNIDVSIFLHGYFFVDAGRNQPVGLHSDRREENAFTNDEPLRRAWNSRLADVGTLPLLPSVLEQAMTSSGSRICESDMTSLTAAIESSRIYSEFRSQICRANCWAKVYDASGDCAWKLFSAEERLVDLPPCLSHTLPWQVFPGLELLAANLNIAVKASPRLVPSTCNTTWPDAAIGKLLASVPAGDVLRDTKGTAYLTDFIEQLEEDGKLPPHATSVARIVRAGMAICGIPNAAKQVYFQRLLRCVPPACRLPVSIGGDYGDSLFREISQHSVDLVFVPQELDPPDNPGMARLKSDDAIKLLAALSERQARTEIAEERESVSIMAGQLLQRVEEQSKVLKAVSGLPLFVARDCRTRHDRLASWTELQISRVAKLLFVLPSPRASWLQSALADATVLLISTDCFRSLFTEDAPSQCETSQIIETLSQQDAPTLAVPHRRVKVVDGLLKVRGDRRQNDDFRRCVRYLLHGDKVHVHSRHPLLVGQAGQSDVWRRITHISLAKQNGQWRLIDSELTTLLRDQDKEDFGVQNIGAESAIPLIEQTDPQDFCELRPSPTEYTTLLREIDNNDLCCLLPIHEELSGNFVSIGKRCYWQSDVPLPPDLTQAVIVLCRSDNDSTWRRQLELARQLDATALIEIILGQGRPGDYWETVMASLPEATGLSAEHLQQLRSAPWLPAHDGESIAPEDLIDLPHIADDAARLTSSISGIFYEPGMLHSAVVSHSSYELLQRLTFPTPETALAMLGELLVEREENHIGPIRRDRFEQWRDVASAMPGDVLPCGALIARAAEFYPAASIRVFEELIKPEISADRIRAFLNYCRRMHHGERNRRIRTSLVAMFNEYLRMAVDTEGYETVLAREQLPSREGEWKRASELCCDNDGIALSSVLNNTTEETLAPSMPALLRDDGLAGAVKGIDDGHEADWSTIELELEAASHRLGEYFAPWQDIVPNEQIGGFLSLLGDDPDVSLLAQKYLGKNRTIEQTRIKFGLPAMPAGDQLEDGLTMMSKQRVVVETIRDESVRVLNLLGTPFQAPRNQTPTNIFVGYGKRNYPFPHSLVNGTRVLCFRLNVIDPRHLNPNDLSKLLRDSAVKFVGEAYNSFENQTTFAAAWDELSESDQLDISIAQERVVENGFLILDQLGLRSNSQIAAVLDTWDAAQRLLAEQRAGAARRSLTGSRNADEEMRGAKVQLRELLETNEDVQSSILEAIRERIAEYYQYTKAAVPFEVFQNADDACVELIEHFDIPEEQRQNTEVFHVFAAQSQVILAHFGRRINQYPLDSPDETRGFDNDLWKMLVLSLSNKLHGHDNSSSVTGKFGLGFKSCYLIAPRPRILSGRLAFEVTGAMYPRRLIANERAELDDCRQKRLEGNRQATLLELPLTDANSDDALADFRRLAHIAVVFARRLRRIIINGGEVETQWRPKPLTGVSRCYSGIISPLSTNPHGAESTKTALQLDSDYGSVLIVIGSRHCEAMPDDIPSIWVTAPTLESLGIGFLINGPFALDVGRAQLAREFDQNRESASRLGGAIGSQLCEVFAVTEQPQGWRQIRDDLRIARDASLYDFWDSLFSLIGNAVAKRAHYDRPADMLVREIFWNQRDQGAADLYSRCRALPTRVRGDYQMLVSIGQVRHALGGLLAEDADLFALISQWETFQEQAPVGSVVSGQKVYEPIKLLAPAAVSHIRPLTIKSVLDWEFKHGSYALPDTAERIGSAINKRTLELVRERSELTELREILDTVEFKGRDNRYHLAKELLLGHASGLDKDEQLRAQFAPVGRVVHEDYQGAAVAFFDVCRNKLDAPVSSLADWVIEASDVLRQKSALEYMAHGQLASGLIWELKRRGLDGTWLEHLAHSEAFRSLDTRSRNRLLELLPNDVIDWDSYWEREDEEEPEALDPESVLQAIHSWWRNQRHVKQEQFGGRTFVEEYERSVYPNGTPRYLATDDVANDEISRTEWATLFLLGLMHTMGRVTSDQNRGFLHRCAKEGWLAMFAASEPDPHKWIGFVNDYIEQQVDLAEYFHWMRQFVGIFQVSRYLEDYSELFLAINRIDRPFRLTEVTRSLTGSLFQGGIKAPPVSHVLGLGSCFVVRELTRLGVLRNEFAHRHCFVPTTRIRNIFNRLGCEGLDLQSQRWEMSARIHSFVVKHLGTENATFENDFDIPFHFIADDPSLWDDFVRRDLGDDDQEDGEQVAFLL